MEPDLAYADLPSAMWRAPQGVSEELGQLHAALVDSLRRDTRHIATGVVGAIHAERLAYYYIRIRHHELTASWPNEKYRVHLYKMHREAALDLAAGHQSAKISPEALHQIVASHTAKIVANVLQHMPREEAAPLYRMFAAALDESDS
ncbi:MAG: hypothetical protein WC054_01120 [Candidatus Nanopelagicales bacterium]